MRKYKLAVFLACACMGTNVAYSMDLSLNDAVEKIIAESNDIKKAEANVKMAHAQLDAVNANRWVNISANASYMNMVDVARPTSRDGIELPPELGGILQSFGQDPTQIVIPDNLFMAGVSISQPIYTFGKIGNAVDSVHSAIKMSETGKEIAMRDVVYSAADLYWTAKMTDEIVKLAEQDLKNAKTSKTKLTATGRANRSNLVKIETDIASKEINLSDAEFNRDTAHRMLKIFAGIDVNEELVLTDNFPSEFEPMDEKQLTSSPQWRALQEQVNMYESQASSKRANGYPTLAAVGSYNYTSMAGDVGHLFDKSGSQSAYWGLSLQVPIFTGGLDRANATVDAMNAEAARQDLDKAKKLTTEQYTNAIRQYNHLRDNLANMQNARDLAAKAYEFSQQRFGAGQTSAVELSEVASGLYQLDIALLNAKYKILMSVESVKKLGE
ncbi:MAG: TolC family protein [Alphaproteobacteria bacterium]|nr:TolC family protein [Alphaproteobacteria bacterium]